MERVVPRQIADDLPSAGQPLLALTATFKFLKHGSQWSISAEESVPNGLSGHSCGHEPLMTLWGLACHRLDEVRSQNVDIRLCNAKQFLEGLPTRSLQPLYFRMLI